MDENPPRLSYVELPHDGGDAEAVALLVGLLRALLGGSSTGRDLIRRVIPEALPWSRYLPPDALEEFAAGLVEAAQAVPARKAPTEVAQQLVEWLHTAEIYAGPGLREELVRPLDGEDFGPVPRPVVPGEDEGIS